ncbi:PREDICTED: 5'-nucleotidase domain-containing protein 3 [Cyprinodon variegatus]|uniref:5'-nucleotidase domain-containing protein 3 n=1 Tax=Cyprinodon variegatus TaxID=28743 RepID=UPI000742A4A5|nr:PREDICTED: 5'-nucleotidase domain-containing protein 3 [Cyprinodon variegatus]
MTPLSRSLSPLVKRTECLWRLGVFRSFLQGQPDRRSIPGCWKRSFRAVSCGGAGIQPLLKPPEAKQSTASLSSSSSSEGPEDTDKLWSVYKETKRQTEVISTSSVDPDTIFANNEMSLRDIEIYGFDYDYTLAFYSSHLHTLIFNIARDILINNHRYPEGLRKYEYIPDFAVRGLHYDVQKRGLHPVPDEEVIAMYEGSHVPLEIMSDFYGKSTHGHTMKQFMDIFSLPEMTLLSCVNDFFMRHNIDYEPVHLYKDVKEAIRDVHVKGIMYRAVEADIGKYICYGEQSHAVLKKLSAHGKKMFLITNSPFDFVDRGMTYIVGKDWRDLFDVVIVQADKPSFFNDRRKPFRRVTDKGVLLWDRIHRLEKGQIYKQGNLYEFLRLTGWRGSRVLYFGDHIYSDLADLTLKHGWRTGAIIPELRKEIKIMNTPQYVHMMTWLQALTVLIEQMQVHRDPATQAVVEEWIKEREAMKPLTKDIFNAQFGSLFRTYHNPTYFSRRLSRFADIYMASISCMLNYDLQHTFFPRRTPLQHEAPFWPEQSSSGFGISSSSLAPQDQDRV